MPHKLRLFLAHSFATEKLNAEGHEDPHGISDIELANMISDWIVEFSNNTIEVVRTCDPYQHYISTQVRRDICSSDLMLCLFTKRMFDHLKKLWLPSTYVISEASAGLMQYPSEHDSHKRLFGPVEERVDREQLGMAFPMDKTAPYSSRSDLNKLRCVPITCGDNEIRTNQFNMIPKDTGTENEHLFDLEFSNLDAHPGDELVYDIAWGDNGGFQDPSKQDNKPNTVGVLTFERGMVQSVALTLQFQRDFDDDAGEPDRILDELPAVYKIDTPRLLAKPPVFWHEANNWKIQDQLQPCQKRSRARHILV